MRTIQVVKAIESQTLCELSEASEVTHLIVVPEALMRLAHRSLLPTIAPFLDRARQLVPHACCVGFI